MFNYHYSIINNNNICFCSIYILKAYAFMFNSLAPAQFNGTGGEKYEYMYDVRLTQNWCKCNYYVVKNLDIVNLFCRYLLIIPSNRCKCIYTVCYGHPEQYNIFVDLCFQ